MLILLKVEVILLVLEMGSCICFFVCLLDVKKFEIYKDGF